MASPCSAELRTGRALRGGSSFSSPEVEDEESCLGISGASSTSSMAFETRNQIHQRYSLPAELAVAELPVEDVLLLLEVE